MREKILTLHPQGKHGVNIDKARYDAFRAAILAVLDEQGEIGFGGLVDAVAARMGPQFDGSPAWFTVSVKLDLEARGEIERVPGAKPQRIRRKA